MGFRRDKEKSVEHMLEKMSTDEQALPQQDLTDLSCLEEPSLIEVEKIIRWVMKYNQTAFDKRKVRPQGMFIVGINELTTWGPKTITKNFILSIKSYLYF